MNSLRTDTGLKLAGSLGFPWILLSLLWLLQWSQRCTVCYLQYTFNPSNTAATFVQRTLARKDFWKAHNPCRVGIKRIALAEYSQMSTYVPRFHSFLMCFLHNLIKLAKLSNSSIRFKKLMMLQLGSLKNVFKPWLMFLFGFQLLAPTDLSTEAVSYIYMGRPLILKY